MWLIWAVAEEVNLMPLAIFTLMRGAVVLRWVTGAFLLKYKPLAPESTTSMWDLGREEEGWWVGCRTGRQRGPFLRWF